MKFELPRVYPITDRYLSGLSHAEQVARLIDGGASLIQFRDKQAAPREFYREAETALRVAHDRKARLIINDRVDIALALGADGVHLGQTDMPVAAARRLLGKDFIIGFSSHNPAQAIAAKASPLAYLAIGPVFLTRSKENPDPIVGLELLSEVAAKTRPLPLVAIGGITIENAVEAIEAGADSVAVIAAVLSDPARIAENMSKLLGATA
jgi:thiamine-phosphate pyrophosphorylase